MDKKPKYTTLHKFTYIHSHSYKFHSIKVSKQKTQTKLLSSLNAATQRYTRRHLTHLKDKLLISNEFSEQLGQLAPKFILNFTMNICTHGVWKNRENDETVLLTSATPVILWTLNTNREQLLRIATYVMMLTAKYISKRHRNPISLDCTKETEVFDNIL